MRQASLRPRLAMTAGLVPHGTVVADIGTDHARLPIYLVREGVSPRAVASDIREGPLQNAAKAIERAGLGDRIELRRSDGFSRFAPSDAGCWVLAGMGGTLIARLLEQAPWLCEAGTTLVLQPMRHAWEARAWLMRHGFSIQTEVACYDAGRPYHAILAVFHSEFGIRNSELSYIYTGELPRRGHPAARQLLAGERALLQTRADALKQAKSGAGEELTRLRQILESWPENL